MDRFGGVGDDNDITDDGLAFFAHWPKHIGQNISPLLDAHGYKSGPNPIEPIQEQHSPNSYQDFISISFPVSKGAFPPSHFCNKLDDKLARKVALVSL
jgi:hypothetical protein